MTILEEPSNLTIISWYPRAANIDQLPSVRLQLTTGLPLGLLTPLQEIK